MIETTRTPYQVHAVDCYVCGEAIKTFSEEVLRDSPSIRMGCATGRRILHATPPAPASHIQPDPGDRLISTRQLIQWLNRRCAYGPPCGKCTYCAIALSVEKMNPSQPVSECADITLETVLWAAANFIALAPEKRPAAERAAVLKGLGWAIENLTEPPVSEEVAAEFDRSIARAKTGFTAGWEAAMEAAERLASKRKEGLRIEADCQDDPDKQRYWEALSDVAMKLEVDIRALKRPDSAPLESESRQGKLTNANINASDSRVCPNCGASGGLILDSAPLAPEQVDWTTDCINGVCGHKHRPNGSIIADPAVADRPADKIGRDIARIFFDGPPRQRTSEQSLAAVAASVISKARTDPAVSQAPPVRLFEAKLQGFTGEDRIELCEPCLRRAMANDAVIHSAAISVSQAAVDFDYVKWLRDLPDWLEGQRDANGEILLSRKVLDQVTEVIRAGVPYPEKVRTCVNCGHADRAVVSQAAVGEGQRLRELVQRQLTKYGKVPYAEHSFTATWMTDARAALAEQPPKENSDARSK